MSHEPRQKSAKVSCHSSRATVSDPPGLAIADSAKRHAEFRYILTWSRYGKPSRLYTRAVAKHSENATSSVHRGHVTKKRTPADVVAEEEGVVVLLVAVWLMVLEAGGVAVGLADELLDDDYDDDSSGDMAYLTRSFRLAVTSD